MLKQILNWFKKGKVKPTSRFPKQYQGEKFVGFKITWPWPGEKDNAK